MAYNQIITLFYFGFGLLVLLFLLLAFYVSRKLTLERELHERATEYANAVVHDELLVQKKCNLEKFKSVYDDLVDLHSEINLKVENLESVSSKFFGELENKQKRFVDSLECMKNTLDALQRQVNNLQYELNYLRNTQITSTVELIEQIDVEPVE